MEFNEICTCSGRSRGHRTIPIATTALAIGLSLLVSLQPVAAEPFLECPSKAFLTQGKVASTFGVNLVTGDYQVAAQSHGVNNVVNAVGFNENDRYFYGWSYQHGEPARIHSNWQVEPLTGVNITDNRFYVGDVSLTHNKYYVYRRGSQYGLYSIGLDPNEPDYLTMNRIVNGNALSLYIYDMAFHPTNGYAYAVGSGGNLIRIDVDNGSSEVLAATGQKGTFGAAYFDVDGNLYISRNNDGRIFRIGIDNRDYTARLFSRGPAASSNDGSRCAIAPVIDESDTNVDFGDAPDSYGTVLASNGARHGISDNPVLYLGSHVDGESDSYVFPLADDGAGDTDDEDGIQLITNIEQDKTLIINATASSAGYLNAWIDLERDGKFDTNDHVLKDYLLSGGTEAVYIPVSGNLVAGDSWARFRLSSTQGLEATGGVSDGEVEDMPVTLLGSSTIVTSYPSSLAWTTLAFEDNWPFVGDYDMNDLVFYLRSTTYKETAGYTKVNIKGEVAAIGAYYANGFAIRLPGVLRSQVDENNIRFTINDQLVDKAVLETGVTDAILVIAENVWDHVGSGEDCTYYRTEPGCGSAIQMRFSVDVPFLSPLDVQLSGIFDPFLFATPGAWHGEHFTSPPGRSYEIHMKNIAPTEKFNTALFANVGQDASDPDAGLYFQTDTGMPWALEVGERWEYPVEFTEISDAYPRFGDYAQSSGNQEPYWFSPEKSITKHLFKE